MVRFALSVVLVAGVTHSPSRAGVIYATGFENPPFANGSQLIGQDGWVGLNVGNPNLNPAAATVTNTIARSGLQSLQVRGADLVFSGTATTPYDAVGSYRRAVNFTVSPDRPLVRLEADLRLDGPAQPTPADFFSLTLAARSGAGDSLGEIGLVSNGQVEAYGLNAVPGSPPVFTAPISLNQWYRVGIDLDFAAQTASYFVDGAFLGSLPFLNPTDTLLRGSLVVYAYPDGGGNQRGDYVARFDNFAITDRAAPEPASLAVFGLLAGGLLAVRRRHKN